MSQPQPVPQTWAEIPKRTCKRHFSSVHVQENGKLQTVEFMLQNPDRSVTAHTFIIDLRQVVIPQLITGMLPRRLSPQKLEELKGHYEDIEAHYQLVNGLRAIFPDETELIHLAPINQSNAVDSVFKCVTGTFVASLGRASPFSRFPRDKEYLRVFREPMVLTLLSAYRVNGFIHGEQNLCYMLFTLGYSHDAGYHALCCRPELPSEILFGRTRSKDWPVVEFMRKHWVLSLSQWIVDGRGYLDLPPREADVWAVLSLPPLTEQGFAQADTNVYRTTPAGS